MILFAIVLLLLLRSSKLIERLAHDGIGDLWVENSRSNTPKMASFVAPIGAR
jgi:hypothetical protein